MTHYRCFVIGDDIAGQMAPYSEHLRVAPHKVFLTGTQVDALRAAFARSGDSRSSPDLDDLGEFILEWMGCPGGVEDGRLYALSTSNPESHWDWYQPEGRFNPLPLKAGRCNYSSQATAVDWRRFWRQVDRGRDPYARCPDVIVAKGVWRAWRDVQTDEILIDRLE